MRFHLGSFVLGAAVGATAVALLPRLRPVLVEVGASITRMADAVRVRAARRREDLEDLVAEARARARGFTSRRGNGRAEPASAPAAPASPGA